MKNLVSVVALLLVGAAGSHASAQAMPQASRLFDAQVGGSYSVASSDYVPNKIRGFGFYGDIDFRANYGVELNFHQLDDPQQQAGATSPIYERTYEAGGRYMRHYGRFVPYAKGLYGRGVLNGPADCISSTSGEPTACTSPNVIPETKNAAFNLAYNMMVIGAGVDIEVHPRIHVRADYEYQYWFGFMPNGLTPNLVTIGVAYHFPPGKERK